MIYRLVLLIVFITNICSAQKYLHLYGRIEPRNSDTVSLYANKSAYSYLSSKELVQNAVLDANGYYYMKIPWNDGAEINLLNGQSWIVNNIFLNPGDSLEMSQVGDQFSANGKGSENVEFAFTFIDKFYRDSTVREEYNNSFGSKNISQFDEYIIRRKNAQLQFLDDFRKKQNLSAEAFEVQKANIIYKYAIDKLQYLWKHTTANKTEGNVIVDNSYFSLINNIKVDKAIAYKSNYYYNFLINYVDAIWMNQIYGQEKSARNYAAQYVDKLKIADSLFTGIEKEFAVASAIFQKISRPSGQDNDSSTWQMFAYLKKIGADKYLYSRLLEEYNNINSLVGKKAPNFTAITKDGKIFNLETLRGKVILLDIWSTTCGPCIKAIPESIKLAKELEDKPFVALNLCMNSTEGDWRKLVAKHKWNGTHIFAKNDAEIYTNYHFNSFPKYILIDKNGNIINLNASKPGNENLENEILKLL